MKAKIILIGDKPALCLTCTHRLPALTEKSYGRCALTGGSVGAAQTCPLHEPKADQGQP